MNEVYAKSSESRELEVAREIMDKLQNDFCSDAVSIAEVINRVRDMTAAMINEQSDAMCVEVERIAKRREIIVSLKY